MSKKAKLPVACPSCQKTLQVHRLKCGNCNTEIEGEYPLPELLNLTVEEQDFILEFVKSSGSLKKMSSKMKRSYPVVRNTLDLLIEKLNTP